MATQLCQKCNQAHPGRVCDYDEKGECAETINTNEVAQPWDAPSKDEVVTRSYDLRASFAKRTMRLRLWQKMM
jgi:hypothetical protein